MFSSLPGSRAEELTSRRCSGLGWALCWSQLMTGFKCLRAGTGLSLRVGSGCQLVRLWNPLASHGARRKPVGAEDLLRVWDPYTGASRPPTPASKAWRDFPAARSTCPWGARSRGDAAEGPSDRGGAHPHGSASSALTGRKVILQLTWCWAFMSQRGRWCFVTV